MAMQRVQLSDVEPSDQQSTGEWVCAQALYAGRGNPYGNAAQADMMGLAQSQECRPLYATGETVEPDWTVPLPPGCVPEKPAETSVEEKLLRHLVLGPLADVVWPNVAQAPGLDCSPPPPGTLKKLGAPAVKASGTGEPGVMVCNRKTDFGLGNHEYYWDKRTGESCGWGPNSRTEKGPSGDPCIDVPGSEGKEQRIMEHCQEHENDWLWIPTVRDCHSLADQAQKSAGLKPIDLPRFGDPDRYWSDETGEWLPMNPVRRMGRHLEKLAERGDGLGGEAGDGGPAREEVQGGGGEVEEHGGGKDYDQSS